MHSGTCHKEDIAKQEGKEGQGCARKSKEEREVNISNTQ